jgi:hypothetical protein
MAVPARRSQLTTHTDCKLLSTAIAARLRYDNGEPSVDGWRRRRFEYGHVSIKPIIAEAVFDDAMMPWIRAANSTRLIAIDLAPLVANAHDWVQPECIEFDAQWAAFKEFQERILDMRSFHVDYAVCDRSLTWLLIKRLECAYFLWEG